MALAALLLASLLLAACGSSSSTTASTAAASAAAPGGASPGRFTAVRECLKKAGITLPQRSGAAPGAPGGFGLGGGTGTKLPNGETREQLRSALRKCGGGLRRGGFAGRLNSAAYRAQLTKFTACMGENGIKLPTPNTTGKGPIFNSKGLDTTSAAFRAAEQKCASLLRFGPGAGGPPGAAGGAPGAGGGAPGAAGGAPGAGGGAPGAPGGGSETGAAPPPSLKIG